MQTIYLDISNKGVIPTIQAKQGDVGRKFLAVITDNGTTLSALENPVFSVWYDGDSGSGNYSAIDGKPAVVFDGKNATVELATQMLTNAGDGEITLVMNDANGHQIGVWNIGYSVESVMGLDSEEVENYYTALSETASNAISAASRAEQAAEDAEESAYYKQNKLAWATDSDIDEMFAGTYEGVEDESPEGEGDLPGGGDAGDSGVYVGSTEPTDPDVSVWVNPTGAAGASEKSTEDSSPIMVANIVGIALNEMMNNTAARYATIQDALSESSATASGNVLAYTLGGVLNIMLLDNISSSTAINVNKDCIIHLNGKTLSLTASGAQLTISAPNVTINGAVSGSAIKKENITGKSSVREYLVYAQGTSLVVNGGLYVLSGIANARTVSVFDLDAASAFDMNGCTVEGNNTSHTFGIQSYGGVKIKKSVFYCKASNNKVCQAIIASAPNSEIVETEIHVEATAPNQTHYAATFAGDATVTGCTIYAELTSSASGSMIAGVRVTAGNVTISNSEVFASSAAIGAYAYGVRCEGNSNATIANCHIETDGYGDVDGTAFGTCAISSTSDSSVTTNGGYYFGSREALSIQGTARINGGVYEGCQHGGAYLSGADIKIKNATFRNVEYTGDCGWNDTHFGAVYCGGEAGNANICFDNCSFESEKYANYGIVAKYTGTNVYLSNDAICETFGNDLRADDGNYIYVGKNVSYRADKVEGNIDTTTYANQEFGFETETTIPHAILSVKDESGNWMGIV